MKFELWSEWHYLFMAAPILIILALYFALRNTSYKVRYSIGCVIGVLSLAVLIMRNIEIYMHNGFDPEIIPLQVCHFGNIMVFIALIFKSKTAGAIAWSLNMFAAYTSCIFADSLANYNTIMSMRAQAYIWGHILIVIGAAYAVLLKIVRLDLKSFLYGLIVLVCLLIPAIVLNPFFRAKGNGINYFYIFDSNGVPFEFLWNEAFTHSYGAWFKINYLYTFSVIGIFLVIIYLIYLSQKPLYKKNDLYDTSNVFIDLHNYLKLRLA